MARTWRDVKAEMARAGLRQDDLAVQFGVSRSTVAVLLNSDNLSEPRWDAWMDAIKACSAGVPTG